jgi:hypothetical protein
MSSTDSLDLSFTRNRESGGTLTGAGAMGSVSPDAGADGHLDSPRFGDHDHDDDDGDDNDNHDGSGRVNRLSSSELDSGKSPAFNPAQINAEILAKIRELGEYNYASLYKQYY